MEAGTSGPTPQEQLQDKLNRLAGAVVDMQGRVNSDLQALRQQVEEANAQHDEIDLTAIMVQIDTIITTVGEIDPAAVAPPAEEPPVEEPPVEEPPAQQPEAPPVGEGPPSDTPGPVEDANDGETAPVGDETGTTGADSEAPVDAVVGDQGEQAEAPPLYVFDGDVSETDTGAFNPAGVATPDGQPLFTYSGDVPGGQPQGDNIGGRWHLYQGPTVAQ